jgi:NAD-dependent SIR2 family protein deacetylase
MSNQLPVHARVIACRDDAPAWVRKTRSNDAVIIRGSTNNHIRIASNQRLTGVVALGCHGGDLIVLDSAVISSRSLRLVDCEDLDIYCEDVDLRRIELFRCRGCSVTIVGDDVLLCVMHCLTREGCVNNTFCIGDYQPCRFLPPPIVKLHSAKIPDSVDGRQWVTWTPWPQRIVSEAIVQSNVLTPSGLQLQQELARFTLPTMFGPRDQGLLFAPEAIPTGDDLLAAIAELEATSYTVTPEEIAAQYDREREEFLEEDATFREKVRAVADLLKHAKYCVVYTGAGISTSANIPDFRGPKGAWTMRDKGEAMEPWDMATVRPTFAHYAITELVRRGLVRYVVTTNCDGLHWRTGLPEGLLEELHGSLYKLYCPNCQQFFRVPYDADDRFEAAAADDRHLTNVPCRWCGTSLLTTGVAFSEGYRSPLEPVVTRFHSEQADLALVLGTSLCVQSSSMYPMLVVGKGKLVLVNIQHTPVDDLTDVRIYAKTDEFFRALMQELEIGAFNQKTDALRALKAVKAK